MERNILISNAWPEKGKEIDAFDRHSIYTVKILAPKNLSETFFEYAERFFEAADKITEFILHMMIDDIGKLDSYFFSIAFLYRHCIELGLKAVGFKYITDEKEQKKFIKSASHNLSEILSLVMEKAPYLRTNEEMKWIKKYFDSLSQVDKESDSFRYPFHILWESSNSRIEGRFTINPIFDKQTHIDLWKFTKKFDAAYEIIKKWYNNDAVNAVGWKNVSPTFIETTEDDYYRQSVVGYACYSGDFGLYTKAYLETANYLKRYMQDEAEWDDFDGSKSLFLPMCYLYRNCVELNLKNIWFRYTGANFQVKCKCMLDTKHSIERMWKKIKPYIEGPVDQENIELMEYYCMKVHSFDSDANKFRYPMSKDFKKYFSTNKRFDFMETGDFFEALNNILDCVGNAIDDANEAKGQMMSIIDWY